LEGIVTERTAEVVKQKEEIEEKNVQIMESIEYAKTIQEAILTSDEFFERVFPEHFVLFKPKDIVSGDFYWAYQTKSEKTFWVAADCTGHGVPGAFMTMIGNSLLNEIIIENGIEEVGTILDRLRDRIIQTLNKDVDLDSDEKMRNGMDISLCCWDKTTNKLFFSGANNPVFIIRNGELIELKGDKQPIGIHKRMTPFTCQEFDLLPGDQIYNFSDGYADQMGGEDEQRFKIANLKKAIVELSTLSLTEQGKKLDDIYVNWKGDVEQMDDVVLIGVKV
jgi:serine phosphatase RsbU (regulator of sigma subunit)